MRSIRMLAALTGTLTLASACGDGGTGTSNQNPTAAFTEVCTQLSCVFTDASADTDGTITGWSWNFGDGATATVQAPPAHVYAAAGPKTVTLTVTDDDGGTNTATRTVTVNAGPANVAPTASFTFVTPNCTAGTPCGFHSTSTDADGTVAGWAWNFGDATTPGETEDVTHTYAAAGTYTVTLTVTDNLGLASTAATQQLVVSAPASQDCTTTGRTAACTLTPSARVTIKITVVSTACELSGNKIEVTAPRLQTAFFNLCNRTPGEEYTVTDAAGAPLVFEAGTPIALKFTGGAAGPNNPPTGDAGIQITGSYPNWTLNIDDGGAAGTPGEPDFNDVVLSVQATLAP
ncbi:MAG: PKD domain-containing protein [Gemmatimonadota bacterium]|nr:PKD domain-containing protein [Gemmatimonadota bacterium]